MKLKVRYHPRQRRNEIPGKNRFVDELPQRDSGHIPTSKECLWKDPLRKKVNFVQQS